MHEDIDVLSFQERFANNATDFVLVDVREVEEFEQGHISGAINIPLRSVSLRADEISADKPVVLVCTRGGRSAMAADMLAAQGYTQLYNLVEGMLGWMARGLPIE